MKIFGQLFLLLFLPSQYFAQNLFPIKTYNCTYTTFCLDCGEVKAGIEAEKLQSILDRAALKLNLNGVSGGIQFQVLVDSNHTACVISHNDLTYSSITKAIIQQFNSCNAWIPAISDGITEWKTSINVVVTVENNQLKGQIDRVEIPSPSNIEATPSSPEIYNKHYTYKNEHLAAYDFTVWQKKNAGLQSDWNENLALDAAGSLWYTAYSGIGVMQNGNVKHIVDTIFNSTSENYFFGLGVDNENTVWVTNDKGIFSYTDHWKFHSKEEIGFDGTYDMVNNQRTGEFFFCADEGLLIYKKGEWQKIDQTVVPELPSNRVFFANRDKKNRLWIGTVEGTVMLDTNGIAIDFNQTQTALKDQCITSMAEDNNGNVYFGLFKFSGGQENGDEGIAQLSPDGTWQRFTTENSGIPVNHTCDMAYDPIENVLWITTALAGLIRYDLKGNWENYHLLNSPIPTSYLSDVIIDATGTIYLGTRSGIVKMKKKPN